MSRFPCPSTFLPPRPAALRSRLSPRWSIARRIYLSAHVLADRDMAVWGVGHELGHFMIQDGIEGHAEFAAERIRWRARQTCASITQ